MSTQGFHGHEGEVEREPAISCPPHPSDGISGLGQPNSPQNLSRPTPTLATRPQVEYFEIHAEETLPVAAADIPKPSLQTSEPPDVASASIAQGDAPIEERAIQTPNSGQKQSVISHLHPPQTPTGLQAQQLLESDSRIRPGAVADDDPLRRGSVGSGSDYHLPTSNLPPELRLESSSRVYLSTMQPPYPHNPLGAAAGVGGSPFPVTQWTHWHPNAQQQGGLLGMHTNPNDTEESSSRNVRMRMTLQDNNLPSADLQLGSWFNPSHHGSATGNPSPRPVSLRNRVYDPFYEAMGLSVDPHMRMFFAKRNQCDEEGQDKRSPDVQ